MWKYLGVFTCLGIALFLLLRLGAESRKSHRQKNEVCPHGAQCKTTTKAKLSTQAIPDFAAHEKRPVATCGDGKAEGVEECDDFDMRKQTCATMGFSGGTLQCNKCKLDITQCSGDSVHPNFGLPCPKDGCGAGLLCHTFGGGRSFCTHGCSKSRACSKLGPPAQCNVTLTNGGKVCGWDSPTKAPPLCGDGYLRHRRWLVLFSPSSLSCQFPAVANGQEGHPINCTQ